MSNLNNAQSIIADDVDMDAVIATSLNGKSKTPKASPKTKALETTAATPIVETPIVEAPKALPVIVSDGMNSNEANEICYESGRSLAGVDGNLTKAIKAFKNHVAIMATMSFNLNVGYMARAENVDRDEAMRIVRLKKYNPDKIGQDGYRTAAQERIMANARMAWSRAKENAGVPKSTSQVTATATKQASAPAETKEARLLRADEIVNPKADVDPFDALTRVVLTLKGLANKYSDKLQGDRGAAWRDWLANAPK